MNDQYIIPVFISGTILLVLFVFFIVVYLLVQKQKQNAYHIEKNRMIFDHQNKLLTTRFEEQERTMNQMSREIHDNIGQLLSFTNMNMNAIAKYAQDPKQAALIEKAKSLLEEITHDVRNISHSLNSDLIKSKGLVPLLEEELESVAFLEEIDCKVDIKGQRRDFEPAKSLLIYRIAQEAIHNITKHASASAVTIGLDYAPSVFTMTITDNGKGFDKQEIYALHGIGFQNMLERTTLLGGSLDIDARPGNGCTITLRVNSEVWQAETTKNAEIPTVNI